MKRVQVSLPAPIFMIHLSFDLINKVKLSFFGSTRKRIHGIISTNTKTCIQTEDGTNWLVFFEIDPIKNYKYRLYFCDGDDFEYYRDFREDQELMQFFTEYEFKDIDPKDLKPIY